MRSFLQLALLTFLISGSVFGSTANLNPEEIPGESRCEGPDCESQASEDSTDREKLGCRSLPEDLKAMREAQSFLLQSMVKKNNSLAETLDLFAKDFSAKKGRLRRADFNKLKGSAEAFRGHAEREKSLISRFESSTEDLLDRVSRCLLLDL